MAELPPNIDLSDFWELERKRLDREIKSLESVQSELDRHVEVLKERRFRLNHKGKENVPARSREVVLISELRPYVKRWIELHEQQFGYDGITKLAEWARVSTQTINGILGKTPQGRAQRTVDLYIADKLLTKMNMTHVLQELMVYHRTIGRDKPLIPKAPESQYFEE